jgi:hypothetical protein
MDKILPLKSGKQIHIYESSIKGTYVIDFLQDEKTFYSVTHTVGASPKNVNAPDYSKVSKKELAEAVTLLNQNL